MDTFSSGDDYEYFTGYEPHTNRLLQPVIFRYLREFHIQSVLDIGCGNGAMARDLAAHCSRVVGIDTSTSGIEEARKLCPQGNFYSLSIYESPDLLPEAEFDMVLSTEVVEHLFEPRALPRFAHRKLKSGGLFLVSTPYHGYWKNLALSVLNQWDKHHLVFWTGGHIKFWSRATLTKLLEAEGFEVVGFHGCGRAPYLWESMILAARKK